MLNSFVFSPPKPNYDFKLPGLLWIPRTFSTAPDQEIPDIYNKLSDKPLQRPCSSFIPCRLFEPERLVPRIILYFHANSEDIGMSADFLSKVACFIGALVLLVEYPGYGVYSGKPSEEQICEDAKTVYDYLRNCKKFQPDKIMIVGRSIGSGPACYLASERPEVGSLVLFSPIASVRSVLKSKIGGFLSKMILTDHFDNLKRISKVTCPVLLIHGEQDLIVPASHSKKLLKACPSKVKKAVFPEKMTHNSFRIFHDFIDPIREFHSQKCIKFLVTSPFKIAFISTFYLLQNPRKLEIGGKNHRRDSKEKNEMEILDSKNEKEEENLSEKRLNSYGFDFPMHQKGSETNDFQVRLFSSQFNFLELEEQIRRETISEAHKKEKERWEEAKMAKENSKENESEINLNLIIENYFK